MMTDPYLIDPTKTVSLNGVKFPLEYLFRGLLVTGAPGSGKTRCLLIPLLQEILRSTGTKPETKAGMVIVDPKNELLGFMQEFLTQIGRSDDLQILRLGDACYNPFSNPFLSEAEAVEKIITFASNRSRNTSQRPRGDDMYWQNAMRSLLGATISIARLTSRIELTFDEVNKVLTKIDRASAVSDIETWLKKRNLKMSQTSIGALTDYFALPSGSTRPCVFTSVSNLVSFWSQSPLKELVQITKTIPEIDPIDVIDSGKILVISCSSASYGASITPFLLALKEHFFTAVLSRDQIEIAEGDTWRKINQARPVFLVADEFQSYLSPDSATGELVALDRMRGFRAGMIAVTQNLASIHSVLGGEAHAMRLISLFANQIFLANICAMTLDQASRILGNQPSSSQSRPGPPLLRGLKGKQIVSDMESHREGPPNVTASVLSQMRTGEFWMRLANGKIFHKQTKKTLK